MSLFYPPNPYHKLLFRSIYSNQDEKQDSLKSCKDLYKMHSQLAFLMKIEIKSMQDITRIQSRLEKKMFVIQT